MKKLIYFLTVAVFFTACYSQTGKKRPIGCGFKIQDNKKAYQNHISLVSNDGGANKIQSRKDSTEITIPVIFHIVYNNKDENIPTANILKELNDLNNDFLAKNTDLNTVTANYKSRVDNPKINFVIADTLLTEKGLIRKKRTSKGDLYKSSDIILPNRFMNVYIGKIGSDGFVFTNPWENHESDAIYLYYKWVGGHYRLLSHETGHWLGLWHIFEGGCNVENDGIDDTPPQSMATGMDKDCDVNAQCHNGEIPMYNNFMDYSDCRCMFTTEQVIWMHKILQKYRPTINH